MGPSEHSDVVLFYEFQEVDLVALGDVANEVVDSDVVDLEVGTLGNVRKVAPVFAGPKQLITALFDFHLAAFTLPFIPALVFGLLQLFLLLLWDHLAVSGVVVDNCLDDSAVDEQQLAAEDCAFVEV